MNEPPFSIEFTLDTNLCLYNESDMMKSIFMPTCHRGAVISDKEFCLVRLNIKYHHFFLKIRNFLIRSTTHWV